MPRIPRVDVGDYAYHVINRSNGRFTVFDTDANYKDFEFLLSEMKEQYDMRILAYVLMPNHWHLLLYPKSDGDLARAMQWLGTTHTRRFHTQTGTIGGGHLYQGRYKSFLIQKDNHLLSVLKYIERNPVRAKLVKHTEDWRWGSAHRRIFGARKEQKLLTTSPVPLPLGYRRWINTPEPSEELAALRQSVCKGVPYGRDSWQGVMVERFKLAQVLRGPGRPKSN